MSGIAVINTRPVAHLKRFSDLLSANVRNADVVEVPTTFCKPSKMRFDGAADLVVFTSPLAVEFGLPFFRHIYKKCFFSAIGQKSCQVLEAHQLSNILFCDRVNTSSLIWWDWFKCLENRSFFKRVIVVQGEGGDACLYNFLLSAGLEARRFFAYYHVVMDCDAPAIFSRLSVYQLCVWVFMSCRAFNVVKQWLSDFGYNSVLERSVAICISERVAQEVSLLFRKTKVSADTSQSNIISCIKSTISDIE